MFKARCGRVTAVAALAVAMCGCSQMAPSGCNDPLNRGGPGPDSVDVSCVPAGSDLQCKATAVSAFLYTCPSVTLDATSSALWTSSDLSIASFTQPGYLKVQAPGVVRVSVNYNRLPSFPQMLSFAVAPGSPAERMLELDIFVAEVGGFSPLPGVQVDVVPDRGSPLACQTGQFGSCLDANLFVLPGTVLIRLTKAGYQTTESRFASSPADGFFWGPTLRMTPLGR